MGVLEQIGSRDGALLRLDDDHASAILLGRIEMNLKI